MFHINVADKFKIHILYSVTFFENRAIYEIMSKSVMEPERPQTALWRCGVCWISKGTRAKAHFRARAPTHIRPHTEICNTFYFSTATMVT
jgi:hypothetical protein